MRKLATCFALVFGFGLSAAQAGPLVLTFLGNGTGTINLPDNSLITTGQLNLDYFSAAPTGVSGYLSTCGLTVVSGDPQGPPLSGLPNACDQGSIGGYWQVRLTYSEGVAVGGFVSDLPDDSSWQFGLGNYSETVSYLQGGWALVKRGFIGNTWSVTEVPVPATLALLGLGLAGIGAARRKQA